jgi:hypothetical protein
MRRRLEGGECRLVRRSLFATLRTTVDSLAKSENAKRRTPNAKREPLRCDGSFGALNLLKSGIGQLKFLEIDSELPAALVGGVLYLLDPGSVVFRLKLFPLVVENHG